MELRENGRIVPVQSVYFSLFNAKEFNTCNCKLEITPKILSEMVWKYPCAECPVNIFLIPKWLDDIDLPPHHLNFVQSVRN